MLSRRSAVVAQRLRRATIVTAITAAVVATAACTAPAPGPMPVKHYPPAPAFASSPATASDMSPTQKTGAASLSADLTAKGVAIDLSRLLNTSQGGYAPMRNTHWLTEQAAQMSSMGLKEIRVDHVFDDSTYHVVRKNKAGQIVYDFTVLDRVLIPLLDNGITPFIALSYMPGVLGSNVYGPPDSLSAWSGAVTALVSHYRDLGHAGWDYEVWNEIDTNQWLGTAAQYNELYAASAKAVKAADPTARVGGGTASGLTSPGDWSGQFIKYLGAHPTVPADFFTVHSYWSDKWNEGPNSRALLDAAGRKNLPIYLTEWNNLPNMTQGVGGGSDSNNSLSGPAYIAKRLFRTFDSEAAKFYYFTPIEGLVFNKPYNGDLGLITVDGHRKASGNVFEMYSHLESTVVVAKVTGLGTEDQDVFGLVTKNSDGTAVKAILWNNSDADSEMSVKLTGLPFANTNFRVQQKNVNATQGNGFADGSTAVVPTYPSASENAPIVKDQSLKPAQSYTDTVFLPPKSVVSIDLAATTTKVGKVTRSAEPPQHNLAAAESGSVVTVSSSIEDAKLGWGQARLNDGRRHSLEFSAEPIRGWSSTAHAMSAGTEWVQVDLGTAKPVDTVALWPRDSQAFDGAGFPDDFTIQGSIDGSKWVTLYTASNYASHKVPSGEQTFEFPAAEYRYLKVTATKLTDGARSGTPAYSFQLQEFEAYRNGVANGGFEKGALRGWKTTGTVRVQSLSTRGGNYAAQLTGAKAKISTLITGLLPNTSYTFGGHARPEASADAAKLTVRDFGGTPASVTLTTPQWGSTWVTFTTGPDNTSAVLELTKKGAGSVWADDFVVTQGATAAKATPAASDKPSKK